MLIFDKYDIKIYACPLSADTPRRGAGRSLAERAAVKRLLREAYPHDRDISIAHRPSGAPFLIKDMLPDEAAEPLPEVSISHCATMVAIALAPAGWRIGIDCETSDRLEQLSRIAPRFLAPEQLDVWGEAPATLWAWTMKEAIYKAALQPGLALEWIPLPLEIPLATQTDDGKIELGGEVYSVMQIDTAGIPAIMMLAFRECWA